MESVTIQLPSKLESRVEKAANEVGVSKSEKIRNDLIEKYYD